MAECPFCQAEVDENLTIFGGTCPICFGEIPGEEAPTDPGEEVRARQEAQDRRGLWIRRTLLLGSVATVTCAGIGIVAAFIFWPAQPLPVIDFDDADFYQPVELVAYVEPPEPRVEDVPELGGPTQGSSASSSLEQLRSFSTEELGSGEIDVSNMGTGVDVRVSEGATTRSGTGDRDIGDLTATMTGGDIGLGGGVELGGVDVGVKRNYQKGVRLTDDQAIIEHLRFVMNHEIPKLTQCYQRILKAEPDLQGRWRLDFTVGAEGQVLDVDIKGRDVAHPEFERCMYDRIQAWQFQPLKADQPVGKTVTFRPG